MKRFRDFSDDIILLSPVAERHIADVHPEISRDQIASALSDPDEVRRSSYKATSFLYYRLKSQSRFICVVVKECPDGYFIATAMTTTKPKSGEVLYVRKS
jgi:hypothetical protein